MAIRVRNYYNQDCEDCKILGGDGCCTHAPGNMKAVCAAEEPEKNDDLYLNDGVHQALADKFSADWQGNGLMPKGDEVFTPRQLAYLRELLQPLCCHITGMHNPMHFIRRPDVFCRDQCKEAWQRATKALGLEYATAVSDPECTWCKDEPEPVGEPSFQRGDKVTLPCDKRAQGMLLEVMVVYWYAYRGEYQWLACLMDVEDSGREFWCEDVPMCELRPAGEKP